MDRKYQIFISSTYIDLIKERDLVTKQILDDHHFPMGMEMFAPSDKKQWATIKSTIDSSDIYILLVGFRYGSIDPDDNVSYTEKEFNYALSKGIPIIVFIKNDDIELEHKKLKATPSTDRIDSVTGKDKLDVFYSTCYDIDQSNINRFRARVKEGKLTGFFNSQKPIDVKSAIAHKIKELPNGGWIKQKYFLQSKFFLILSSILLIISSILFYRENLTIRQRLKTNEEELFSYSKESSLEFARVVPDYATLMTETNIGETFRNTKSKFYFISNAGKVFYDYDRTIDSCVKRGVVFKILLVDTASENPGNINHILVYDPNKKAYETKLNKMRSDFASVIELLSKINNDSKLSKHLGQIELRIFSGPITNQMWIKDPESKNGLAHFNTVNYTGFKPHFRVTPTSSPQLFQLFVKDFEDKWNDSTFAKPVF